MEAKLGGTDGGEWRGWTNVATGEGTIRASDSTQELSQARQGFWKQALIRAVALSRVVCISYAYESHSQYGRSECQLKFATEDEIYSGPLIFQKQNNQGKIQQILYYGETFLKTKQIFEISIYFHNRKPIIVF